MSKFSIALRLFIITSVTAVFLAFSYKITAPITEINNQKTFQAALKEALPSAKEFKQLDPGKNYEDETITVNSIYTGYEDKEQETLKGYVVTVTSSKGYGGDVCVMVGIDPSYKVTKVIISSPFSETPGLGAKAKKPAFLDQFTGKNGDLEVVKGEAKGDKQISAISSATITSKAVTSCVNAAVAIVKETSYKATAAAEEIKQVAEEKVNQSNAELDAALENRKDEPTPTIIDDAKKEDEKND
ncbi:MAG: FMN-binding protein [Clostridia bacterium]|nr:FMN-binding protein [Clostridia bacterium]